jgi:predicted DNA-binding transcriptional regulator AlpA
MTVEKLNHTLTVEVLRPDAAAEYLGITLDMLQRWRTAGTGPRFMPWGHRTVRYRIRDLDDWLDAQRTAANTAEAARMRQSA